MFILTGKFMKTGKKRKKKTRKLKASILLNQTRIAKQNVQGNFEA